MVCGDPGIFYFFFFCLACCCFDLVLREAFSPTPPPPRKRHSRTAPPPATHTTPTPNRQPQHTLPTKAEEKCRPRGDFPPARRCAAPRRRTRRSVMKSRHPCVLLHNLPAHHAEHLDKHCPLVHATAAAMDSSAVGPTVGSSTPKVSSLEAPLSSLLPCPLISLSVRPLSALREGYRRARRLTCCWWRRRWLWKLHP